MRAIVSTRSLSPLKLWRARADETEVVFISDPTDGPTDITVEGVFEACVIVNARGSVAVWYASAQRMLGWDDRSVVGHSFAALLAPSETRTSQQQALEVYLTTSLVRFADRRLILDVSHRSGRSLAVELTAAALDGKPANGLQIFMRELSGAQRATASRRNRSVCCAPSGASAENTTVSAVDRERTREDLTHSVVTLARQQLSLQIAWICELQHDEQIVTTVDGNLSDAAVAPGMRFPRAGSLADLLIRAEIPNVVHDASDDAQLAALPAVREFGIRSFVGVPVVVEDEQVIATLCAASTCVRAQLDERDAAYLHGLAALLSRHIQEAEHEARRHRARLKLTAMEALLVSLDARDHYTGQHSAAVVELATAIARELALGEFEVEAVGQVALLHDLGKIGIPDAILHKTGPLSEAEWAIMREHPAIGARIIASIDALAHLAPACRAEHERWDGAGYPDGLAGPAIPVAARIVLAADAYHAMTSDRPYRRAMDRGEAMDELEHQAGVQFDPDVVAALLCTLQ